MDVAETFITEVRQWIGTPYVKKGCKMGPTGGTNCGHFFLECVIKVIPGGDRLVKWTAFGHNDVSKNRTDLITPTFAEVAYEIPMEEMKRGDIPILEFFHMPVQPIIYLGEDQYIYCTRGMGVEEGPLPSNLKNRIIRVYRWKGE